MVAAGSLLDVWEQASRLAPSARPLALLSLTFPDSLIEALAALPLGVRDAHLLRLRQALFGNSMDCLTGCPACGAELEFTVAAADLLLRAGEDETGDHWLQGSKQRICFRTPNSTDLIALSRLDPKSESYQQHILSRCLIEVQETGESSEPAGLSPDMVGQLAKEMERRDPLAMIWLDLGCEQCGHAWQSLFDVAGMLWADVDRWAKSVLRQVHLLAQAYGWTERDVLQLSALRRAHYLGMIGA